MSHSLIFYPQTCTLTHSSSKIIINKPQKPRTVNHQPKITKQIITPNGRRRGEKIYLRMTQPTNGITPTNTNNKTIWKRPTIPHCSFATLIGFCIRVKLLRSLPSRFKVEVRINPGSHSSEGAVNQQLADKERLSAALENEKLLGVVNKCIVDGMML